MQVISFANQAESLLKAALLTRLHQLPLRPIEELQNSLFPVETINADDATLNDVQFAYLRRFGREAYNYSQFDIEQLLKQLDWARRFVAPHRHELLLTALEQFLTEGMSFVKNGLSVEAREFLSRIRRVKREVRKVTAATRFEIIEKNGRETLIGHCQFKHDIADLVLSYFMERYPQQRIELILPDGVLAGEQGRVMRLMKNSSMKHNVSACQ